MDGCILTIIIIIGWLYFNYLLLSLDGCILTNGYDDDDDDNQLTKFEMRVCISSGAIHGRYARIAELCSPGILVAGG